MKMRWYDWVILILLYSIGVITGIKLVIDCTIKSFGIFLTVSIIPFSIIIIVIVLIMLYIYFFIYD